MTDRDDAALRAALLDLDGAYARVDDLADQLAALELENRELRVRLDQPHRERA